MKFKDVMDAAMSVGIIAGVYYLGKRIGRAEIIEEVSSGFLEACSAYIKKENSKEE